MVETSLRSRLAQVADLAGDDFVPPTASVFAARLIMRRRRRAGVATTVAAVLVVASAVTLWTGASTQKQPLASAPRAALPRPHVPDPPGHVTAAQLGAYRWSKFPDAPISDRSDGVAGAWTGNEMIVWGGAESGHYYGDGASYDPARRTWHKLPRSPLGPRAFTASAWTGHELFLWGGVSSDGGSTHADGATYSPATRTWRKVPPLPITEPTNATAAWTGSRVVLLTIRADQPSEVDAHVYNPFNDTWTTLPPVRTGRSDALSVSALVVSDKLFVWMPVQSGARTANVGFMYDPARDAWQPSRLLPTQPRYGIGKVLAGDDHVIFAPNGSSCTNCGGFAGASTGSWADPRTGAVIQLTAWQRDPLARSDFVWTGAAILAVGTEAQAAAWSPATQLWANLADPPFAGGAVHVWTGEDLLIWGHLMNAPSRDPNAGSSAVVNKPVGLAFTP